MRAHISHSSHTGQALRRALPLSRLCLQSRVRARSHFSALLAQGLRCGSPFLPCKKVKDQQASIVWPAVCCVMVTAASFLTFFHAAKFYTN